MFDDGSVGSLSFGEVLWADRPQGWTDADEQLMAQQTYDTESRFWDPEPTPANTQPSGLFALELDTATASSTATASPTALSDAELLDAAAGFEHVAAWAQARQAGLIAQFAARRPGDDPQALHCDRPAITSRYAPDEIGLALRLSRGSAMARIGQSVQLSIKLPGVLQAWEHGVLDERKVRAICDATFWLSAEKSALVQDQILPRAGTQSLAQLRAAVAKAVLVVDADGAGERHRKARRDRRVSVGQESEGMASMWALLSAPDARAAFGWLTLLARGMGSDDPRGMDARRADLMAGLLTGQLTYARNPLVADPDTIDVDQTTAADAAAAAGAVAADATDTADTADTAATADEDPAGSAPSVWWPAQSSADAFPTGAPPRPVTPAKPLVQVVMAFTTLAGADDQPGELIGYGPIAADLAREIAADATLHRLVTDPVSGALLDYGRTTYRPPAALADFLRGRDVYCREPMCRRRAMDAELDHIIAFPTGTTSAVNMGAYCVMHHKMKHAAGFQVQAHADGRIEWITPTGHSYFSRPHDYRPTPEPTTGGKHPTESTDPELPSAECMSRESEVSRSAVAGPNAAGDIHNGGRAPIDTDPPPF